MKVAFITYQYPPKSFWGGSFYALKLTHALEDLGVDLLRIGPSHMQDEGIKLTARNFFHFAWKARKQIGGADLVHGNILADVFVTSVPCVTTMHHAQKFDYPCSSMRKTIYEKVEERCFKKARKVITDSMASLRELEALHGDGKICSVPLGVDLVKTDVGDPRKVLCATGLSARKGVELLLHTARELGNRADFYITGNGGEKQRLESLAARMKLKNMHFLGIVGGEELSLLYSQCGICIIPSIHEGFGLPVLEGMARGKAVIATNTGIAPEIIENGKNGFLINERNPKLVSSLIIKLAEDEKLFKKVAQRARETSRKFSWHKTARETIKVYKMALSE
jgi:glycosyltransferase involved in cell wall biosynthesis